MGVSQGNFSAGPVGLQLVAWALFTGAGTLIKSSGIASVSRSAVGTYVCTFTAARASANYHVDSTANSGSTAEGWQIGQQSKTTVAVTVTTLDGFSAADPSTVHVAVYE